MNSRSVRLLAFASALLAALCSDASAAALDAGFGHDGRVAVELGIFGSRANAVAAQADGKIVAAGYAASSADRDFMLFRLLPDGSLDTSFNYDGTVTTAVGAFDDEALAVAVQADGKIIAAGYSGNGENRDFALVRYNSDGSVDRSFGAEGMVVTAVSASHDEITDIAVQEDGGIIIVGAAQGADGKVAVLARYLTDGSVDSAFADEGFALSVAGREAQAEGVALGKDGRILLSGSYSDGQRRGLLLLGFDSQGRLDKKFGKNGIAVPADSSVFSEGYGMAVSEDGAILVAGSAGANGARDAALFRFTADGSPDSAFERNGVLVTAVSSGDDVLHDVVLTGTSAAATGFETDGKQRKFLLLTYSKNTGGAEENSGSLTMQTASAVVSTGFGGDSDTATALAAVSEQSVVAVGESEAAAGSSAAVSKYMMAAAGSGAEDSASTSSSAGSEYVWTGAPYDVTRTTAIVPAEVRGLSGTVSKRGIVFSTVRNPSLKDSSSASGDGTGAPVMSDLSPQKINNDSTATLQVNTDVAASCKYDDTAGTAYDQMENSFSTEDGKSHLKKLTDVTDGSYTYYVRCKNTSSGAVNTTDGVISFTVEIGSGGNGAPVISNLSPSGTVTTTSATLSLSTDVNATCKYDTTTGTAYDDMENTFSNTGAKTHSQSVTGLQNGDEGKYYVRCKNTSSGAVNTADAVISFTVDIGSGGSSTTPTSVKIYEDMSEQYNVNNPVELSVTTEESATCKYSSSAGEEFENMIDFSVSSNGGKIHSSSIKLDIGKYQYYVRCKDNYSNSDEKSIIFSVTPVIISYKSVSGGKLSVSTDVKADCRYSVEEDEGYETMENFTPTDDGKTHESEVFAAGKHTVYVRCQDKSTPPKERPVGIKIEIEIKASAALSPSSDALFASSDQLINTALRNVGSFFLSTAVAQTNTASTTDTDSTSTSAATTSTTKPASTSSNSSTASTSSSSTTSTKFREEGNTEEGGGSGAFSSKLTNLKPGTFFYARAYAVSGGVTYYGNEVGFRTADSCFVATAAYGSVFHPAVQVLRDFRNQFLSGSAVSRAAVELYYQVSPALADVVSQHSGLRLAVRLLLLPVTGAAWLLLQSGLWALLLPAAGGGLAWGWQELKTRRRSLTSSF